MGQPAVIRGEVECQANGESEPEIGLAATKFLTDRKAALIGADPWAIQAVPHETDELVHSVHPWNLAQHGVYRLENLAGDKVYEIASRFSPLRLRGVTGSRVTQSQSGNAVVSRGESAG